jgi:hypothetical protein
MITVNRVFAAVLVAFAGVWLWAAAMGQREVAADNAFRSQEATAFSKTTGRRSEVLRQEVEDIKEGGLPDRASLEVGLRHMKRRAHFVSIRLLAQFGFMGSMAVWLAAMQIQAGDRRRRWESPERPAVADAGKRIGELVRAGSTFVAKAGDGVEAPKVEVDGRRAVVAFRRLAFVRAFVGNSPRDYTEMPFSDLIAGSLYPGKGQPILLLRTTHGRVWIPSSIQPFQELVDLLIDATELNRTRPEQYRAALAREPHVRTPWYGWLIIAGALALVAVVSFLLLST